MRFFVTILATFLLCATAWAEQDCSRLQAKVDKLEGKYTKTLQVKIPKAEAKAASVLGKKDKIEERTNKKLDKNTAKYNQVTAQRDNAQSACDGGDEGACGKVTKLNEKRDKLDAQYQKILDREQTALAKVDDKHAKALAKVTKLTNKNDQFWETRVIPAQEAYFQCAGL